MGDREQPFFSAGSLRSVGRTVAHMEITCAECGCLVDRGARVIPCETAECCCRDLPIRETEDSGDLH